MLAVTTGERDVAPLATAPSEDEPVDRARVRGLVVDANDGIIAIAGIGEGFVGAGASQAAALLAVLAATIAGSVALAGAKYAEAANERDAVLALVEEESRQLSLSPTEELAELTELYERKGLSNALAAQVAAELSQINPLVAHAEAEHGIDLRESQIRPLAVAVGAASAFIAGALVVIATIMFSPASWRSVAVFVATAVSLAVTSAIAGRWGSVPFWRTVARTVVIGISALLLSLAVGSFFDL
jgi:VIT1/CCC1 family predicted Fe2+/Mn2+ transporter